MKEKFIKVSLLAMIALVMSAHPVAQAETSDCAPIDKTSVGITYQRYEDLTEE